MTIKEIQSLIKFVSKADVAEVKYKTKDFEITIKSNYGQPEIGGYLPQTIVSQAPVSSATAPAVAPAGTTQEAPAENENSNYIEIKSPMIGTFYRKPSPDKDVFVQVGDSISAGDTVCVIEAMKLFNEIESEVSGKIVKVLVDDSSPVEYDQPLFLVDPS